MPFSTIKLNDGRHIPEIGFGSWKLGNGQQVSDQVEQALDVGFEHVDTAQVYRNEEEVGAGIKDSGLSRDDVWITSKWSGAWLGDKQLSITDSLKATLAKLGVEYLDLYLIHSASLVVGRIPEAWAELVSLQEQGLVKSIGVSNFQISDLEILLASSKVKPVVNQILFNAFSYDKTKPLLAFMHKHGIVAEAYSALVPITSQPGGAIDKVVAKIAEKHKVAPEQIHLAWVHAKGAVIVTTSSKRDRLERYLASADIQLSASEIEAFEKAGRKGPPADQQLLQKVNRSAATKAAVVLAALVASSVVLVAVGHGELAAMGAMGGTAGLVLLALVYLVAALVRGREA